MHAIYTFLLLLTWLLPHTLFANMQPKNVLAKSCLEYYKTYEGQGKHKAFVYARETETGKDRCNWAYGHASAKEAVDSAMKGCQSVMLNAECILLDSDGTFKVADGTFTALEPADDTPLSEEEKKKLSDEAKSLILGNCSPFFTKNYLEAKGHKSFGYSIDANGHYACGYSYGNQTEKISKKRAIKSCEDNKLKRGKKAPKSPCKVYATNKHILLHEKDFGVDMEKKEEVFLSSKVYSEKLAQAKETIDDGACLLQMKYYLRGEMQQAYYFAKADGKQACGREEGAFTLKQAKEKAKKSCEKMAKEQKIKAECKLFAQNFEIVAKTSDYVVKMSEKGYERALHKGKIEEVKKYIAKGYDLNMQTKKDGITALFLAAGMGDEAFFFELVKKGADLKHKVKDGSTLLHATVLGRNIELVKYVLSKGFDINAKGFNGNTPLHAAIAVLDSNILKLLMKKGAKTDIKNDKGKTASELFKGLKLNLDEYKPKNEKKSKQEVN